MGTNVRLCAKAQPALMPGESAVAGHIGTSPVGSVAVGGAMFGVVGALAAQGAQRAMRARTPDDSSLGGRLDRAGRDRPLVLVVTTHRIVVFEKGLGSDLRRAVLGVNPADLRRANVVSGAFKTPCVELELADGSTSRFKLSQSRGLDGLREALSRLAPHAAA